MKQSILDFYENIGKKKWYWIPLILLAVGAFGYSLTCRTVSIDDLRVQYYYSSEYYMISGGYWGEVPMKWLAGCLTYAPFFTKFTTVLFLLLDGFLLGAVLYRLNGGRKNVFSYMILSAGLLTFPLISEMWEYYGAVLTDAMALVVSLLTVLYYETEKRPRKYLWACAAMAFVVSASLLSFFIFISLVMMLLFYKYAAEPRENHPRWKWVLEGLGYAVPLMVGLGIRFLLQVVLQKIFNAPYAPASDVWIEEGLQALVKTILYNGYSYAVKGLVYFPIAVFDLAGLCLLILACRQCGRMKSPVPLLIWAPMLVSLFAQSLIQRHVLPYRHTFAISILVGFTMFLLAEQAEKSKKTWLRRAVAAVLLLICWNQASALNQMFALNNLRSDNELALVRSLGYTLTTEYERKPVAFVGVPPDDCHWAADQVTADPHALGSRILIGAANMAGKLLPGDTQTAERLANVADSKYTQTNLQATLDWHRRVPYMMRDLFSYCGYDIPVVEMEDQQDLYNSLWDAAEEQDMSYLEICDTGDYLIVCLGDLTRWTPDW